MKKLTLAVVGLLATLSLMMVGVVLAQVPAETKVEDERAVDSERPSLEQLTEALTRHERNYLPFHVKAMETLRRNEGLTAKERRSYPWADGRKHQRLMEYAQHIYKSDL